jgi:hypothetical protein
MTTITVKATMQDYDTGNEYLFGGETGSIEFYMVKHALQDALGDNQHRLLYYNHDDDDELFVIEDRDESCDNSDDYIEIITSISKLFTHGQWCILKFAIMQVQ